MKFEEILPEGILSRLLLLALVETKALIGIEVDRLAVQVAEVGRAPIDERAAHRIDGLRTGPPVFFRRAAGEEEDSDRQGKEESKERFYETPPTFH